MMNNGQGFGDSWTTAVTLPATPAFGTGQWAYAQLITPGEYLTINGVLQTSTDTQKGDGLDASFPYNNGVATSIQATDGIDYTSGDSPSLGVTDSFDSATLTDTFHTWVMFKPPGTDVRWVPLSETKWETSFMVNIPAGGWSKYPVSESIPQIKIDNDFAAQNKFPSWTQIVPSGLAFNH